MNKEQFKRRNEKTRLINTYIKTIHHHYEPEPNINVRPKFYSDLDKERILWHKKQNKIIDKITSLLDKIDDLYDNRPKMSKKDIKLNTMLKRLDNFVANTWVPINLDPHCNPPTTREKLYE